jgi:uncharacterized protein (DUF1800 family)
VIRQSFLRFARVLARFWLAATLALAGLAAHASNYTDIWWNPEESGWGVTITHHHDKVFAVWYIYDPTGKPLWIVMPDGQFSNGGRTFSGDIYRTQGPPLRSAFRADAVKVGHIGTARIDFEPDDVTATATYSISNFTASKRITRQPFGSAPPNFPSDHSDLYWNPSESGWGLAINHHGDDIFAVWYTYGDDGEPLWLVLPGGRFTSANTFTGKLYTTRGTPFNATRFDPRSTQVTEVGTATLEFRGNVVQFTATVNGTTITKTVSRQGFGKAPDNRAPTVQLEVIPVGDASVAPASFRLRATPADSDGTIAKVAFFQGCVKIGEVKSAPWEITVTGLAAGTYTFSAQAVDDDKATALATSAAKTVGPGTGNPPPPPVPGNASPTVTLTGPAAGASITLGATFTFTANAADSDGTVAKVSYLANGNPVAESTSSPWSATWKPAAAGTYTVKAVATDNLGATTTTAGISVEVKSSSGTTNKAPTVSLTAPTANATFMAGTAVTITANASDPDGTVAKVEFFSGTTKIGEALAAPFSTSWPAVAGSHSLTAVATDDKGATKTSTAVAILVIGPAVPLDAATRDAARFLTQATFGIRSPAEIDALKARGYESWLAEQFSLGASSHVQYVQGRVAAGEKADEERAYEAIWQQWLTESGQLRARMAFALSEIVVISNIAPDLNTWAMASYMDLLNRNAFGNYRQLLEEVTLHPAMGYYLNMIGSKKADPAKGTHPNENYAREIMQLFSIGLVKLNPDGSRQLDAQGQPIPTYDEAVVKALAAAFTGWNFAGNDNTKPAVFDPAKENWLDPMIAWEMHHDTGAKTLFNGIVLPAGQNARKDLTDALDAIFNHPNVGPFIGRQLIQRFVTSNPSPAYIARVAAAFANNGSGVRGDLRATLRAVLLDPEARSVDLAAGPTWGKQREPVIRFANYLRALGATSTSGRNRIWYLDSADEGLNQSPLLAPSVFNFFSPNYRQPGAIAAAGLVSPEFQVTTETSMVGGLNFFAKLVKNGGYGSGETKLAFDLAPLNALAADPGALADRLNLLFYDGAMSAATRANLVTAIGGLAAPKADFKVTTITDRVKAALMLTALSPEFVIQK